MSDSTDVVVRVRQEIERRRAISNGATEVQGSDWSVDTCEGDETQVVVLRMGDDALDVWETEVAEHFAANDPAAVLRLCDAAEKLIDVIFQYEAQIDGEWGCCHSADEIEAGKCRDTQPGGVEAIRLLAAGLGVEVESGT